jgi:hypothetical protein
MCGGHETNAQSLKSELIDAVVQEGQISYTIGDQASEKIEN